MIGYISLAAIEKLAVCFSLTGSKPYIGSLTFGIETIFGCYTNFSPSSFVWGKRSWSRILHELEYATEDIMSRVEKGDVLFDHLYISALLERIVNNFDNVSRANLVTTLFDRLYFSIAESIPIAGECMRKRIGLFTYPEVIERSASVKILVKKSMDSLYDLGSLNAMFKVFKRDILEVDSQLAIKPLVIDVYADELVKMIGIRGVRIRGCKLWIRQFFDMLDTIYKKLQRGVISDPDNENYKKIGKRLDQLADHLVESFDLKNISQLPKSVKNYRERRLNEEIICRVNAWREKFGIKKVQKFSADFGEVNAAAQQSDANYLVLKAPFLESFAMLETMANCTKDAIINLDGHEMLDLNTIIDPKYKPVIVILLFSDPKTLVDDLLKVTNMSSEKLKFALSYFCFDRAFSDILVEKAKLNELPSLYATLCPLLLDHVLVRINRLMRDLAMLF